MTTEMDSDSNVSNYRSDNNLQPPSRWQHDDSSAGPAGGQRVRLMCSFGGRILPRPHDQKLRYVGGDTRIIAIPRSASFSTLLSKLAKIAGSSVPAEQISIKYQLPNEDLDALVSLTSDEDVDNMMDEYDRVSASRTPRLRLFLFHPGADPVGSASSSGTAFGSILDGGSKTDDWFLDALNGSGAPSILERGRSEVSSIVSEVPDYLFGFDNNSDETPTAAMQALPAPADLYLSEKASTNLPPLETKPGGDFQTEPPIHQQTGFIPNPVWHYVADQGPVYYVPGPLMPVGNLPVQPAQMSLPFAHQVVRGQGPFGYTQPVQTVAGNPMIHGASVYVGGTPQVMAAAYEYPIPAVAGEAYEVVGARGLIRHPAAIPSPIYQTPGISPAGAEVSLAAGSDFKVGRTSQ